MSMLFILVILIMNGIIDEGILSVVAEESCVMSSDCQGRKDGQKSCCMYNTCQPCQQCFNDIDCYYSQTCCFRPELGEGVCSDSCLGERCQRSSYCASNECCLSNRCSNCSSLGCTDHENCPARHYCCDALNTYGNRSCKTGCVADSCVLDEDCAYPEYCKNNRCSLLKECETYSDCKNGLYKCCPVKSNRFVKLCALDCDNVCASDDDCGPPNECCYSNSCHRCYPSCASSSDCPDGELCCHRDKKCTYNSDCGQEACVANSDCVYPGRYCSDGICGISQQCNSSTDCIASGGHQQPCCIDGDPPYYCLLLLNANAECPVVDSDHEQDNSNHFPFWLIGVLVGFLVLVLIAAFRCYFLRKKHQQSNENTIHETGSERGRNISNEIQVRFEHGEPNACPPPYTPNNPLTSHSNVADCPNVPPPPYSFDNEIFSPDRNNDSPPQYRLFQF